MTAPVQPAVQPQSTQDESSYEDYFGFEETKKWYFPDGKQFIEFKVMNEGEKARFQKLTNSDIVVERGTNNARLKVDAAAERHALLQTSVVGWNLYRQGKPVPFSNGTPGSTFMQWLTNTNPKLVEDLEREVRKSNPWLMDEMSVEDIDKEMANLQEMREAAVKREAEKKSL